MNFLLAILVVVAQVAGPWLCCCGVPRLFAQEPSCCAKPVPQPIAEPACPMCKGKPQCETTTTHDPASHPHDQGFPDPCPMGGKSFEALPPTVIDSGTDLRSDLLLDSTSALTVAEWLSLCQPIDAGTDENLSELPFLTTETRLFTHHALRC